MNVIAEVIVGLIGSAIDVLAAVMPRHRRRRAKGEGAATGGEPSTEAASDQGAG